MWKRGKEKLAIDLCQYGHEDARVVDVFRRAGDALLDPHARHQAVRSELKELGEYYREKRVRDHAMEALSHFDDDKDQPDLLRFAGLPDDFALEFAEGKEKYFANPDSHEEV